MTANEVVQNVEEISGERLNGAQSESISKIATNYTRGEINKKVAIFLISRTAGISKEEAEEVLTE